MLRDRILAMRETQVYEPRSWRHFMSGVRVLAVDGDTIRARANFLVTEAMSDAEPTLFLVGRTSTRWCAATAACCSASASRCTTTITCAGR